MKKRPPCSAQTWECLERTARIGGVPVSALVGAVLDDAHLWLNARRMSAVVVAAGRIVEAQRVHRAARTAEACRRSAAARQP